MVLSKLVGARIRRKEDPRLITGSSTYVDDLRLPGLLHLALVRSPYPHARITRLDTSEAERRPGVVAIITGDELREFCGPIKYFGAAGEDPTTRDEEQHEIPYYPMANDVVRFVGEIVVAVAAETGYAARDAAEAIAIDWEPLPAIIDPLRAMADGAPQIWENLPNNVGIRWRRTTGDVEAAFESAPVVLKQRIRSQRLAGIPMETRGVVAMPDPLSRGLTIWSSTQAPHWNRTDIAEALGLHETQVRVVAPEVGGGFGVKIGAYQEDFIVAAIAHRLQRPIKWIETRTENMQATHHGRDQFADIELAADQNGRIAALRLRVVQDLGFYPKDTDNAKMTGRMICGCYDIPAVDAEAIGVVTNTMAIGAYRGAGRPEAAYYIERAIDLLAAKIGRDPVEVRRTNFIRPEQFPYTTATRERYDTGDYEKALNRALEISNYHELRLRAAELRRQGRYLGIGLSSYVEICAFGPFESATVRVEPSGAVSVFTGIKPQGQGQETTFAQMVADQLGVDFDAISVYHGDTAMTPQGNGTMGSRGLVVGGSAVVLSLEKVRHKAMRIAAHLLEASVEDIEIAGGRFRVKGAPDRSTTLAAIATLAYEDADDLPKEIEAGLESTDFFRPDDETFPFGTHIAVVEVFPDDGRVTLLDYFSVDDCGHRLSPMLVEGQVHGGLAQGIAQALLEEVCYDANGQLLTGSLMDYAIPKASTFPTFFTTDQTVTGTPLNPLGAKGIGEAATVGSTPALANAVVDALKPFGIHHVDVPFRPQRIWGLINQHGGRPM